jgi:hypothetical protein
MALSKQEKYDLKRILAEVQESINTYEKLKETGNSQCELKEFYRGKHEAYLRQKVLLERYMTWHGISQ